MGYLAAGVAVLVFAAYPVATRAGVTGAFRPDDLVLLRFGVAALLFVPYFVFRSRALPPGVWRTGAPLSVYQGAGMAALVIYGLQYAPASHAAALGPGVMPAWVALFAYVLNSKRPSPRRLGGVALIALGAVALLSAGNVTGPKVMIGDLLFIGAAALGALYFLRLRESGLGVFGAAAVVSVYSTLAMFAWYAIQRIVPFAGIETRALLWQTLWQGVLIGFVALVALNHAIARLGGERTSALLALVPVIGLALGGVFLMEIPTAAELLGSASISIGVALCAAQAGKPAASSARAKISACGLSRPG
jgi:drug/metabolite transporter (DMT)-like permease